MGDTTSIEFELQRQITVSNNMVIALRERIAFLEQCLMDNVRPLEFVQMDEIDSDMLGIIRNYVALIDQMDGRSTTARDMTDLDAQRAELHNEIVGRLQARRIMFGKRGDVTDFCFKVVKWMGR